MSEELLMRIYELAEHRKQLEAEVLEQCRINGMGAERELALMAKVERLEKRLEIDARTKYDGIDCRDATIRELERENAELRKDAERYRWLRHADLEEASAKHWPNGEVPEGDEFDGAIDAAMKDRP
jgi:hypothetical protein